MDNVAHVLHALHGTVFAWQHAVVVQDRVQLFIEDLVDEAALATAAHTGDTDEYAQRQGHVEVTQVVLLCPSND